jgi:hypothetical protein
MTDGVFSAEEMFVPAVVVNGRPRCPLPPRPSKSASKEKQYYCEDVAGHCYQDDGSPYQGSKLSIHYCPEITSPEAVFVAKGLNLFGKLWPRGRDDDAERKEPIVPHLKPKIQFGPLKLHWTGFVLQNFIISIYKGHFIRQYRGRPSGPAASEESHQQNTTLSPTTIS